MQKSGQIGFLKKENERLRRELRELCLLPPSDDI